MSDNDGGQWSNDGSKSNKSAWSRPLANNGGGWDLENVPPANPTPTRQEMARKVSFIRNLT